MKKKTNLTLWFAVWIATLVAMAYLGKHNLQLPSYLDILLSTACIVSMGILIAKIVSAFAGAIDDEQDKAKGWQIALAITLLKKNKRQGDKLIGEARLILEDLLRTVVKDETRWKALLHDAAEEIDNLNRIPYPRNSRTETTTLSPTPTPAPEH